MFSNAWTSDRLRPIRKARVTRSIDRCGVSTATRPRVNYTTVAAARKSGQERPSDQVDAGVCAADSDAVFLPHALTDIDGSSTYSRQTERLNSNGSCQ